MLPEGLGCTPSLRGYTVCEPVGSGWLRSSHPSFLQGMSSVSEIPRRRGYVLAITARSRGQLVAERRCLLGLVPWRGTSLGRAFRAGLTRGWHAVLPIILPAGEFPCWCRWRACLVVALRDGGLALLLDRACAGLCTLFLEARALCQSELQVEGAMTICRSLLRSREGWHLRHGPAAAEVAFSLTHSMYV